MFTQIPQNTFIIKAPRIENTRVIYSYSYQSFSFTETHDFPFPVTDSPALRMLTIATSLSYYKLHLAPTIHIAWKLTRDEQTFWQWVIKNGFSELIYTNKLHWDIVDRVKITCEDGAIPVHHPTDELFTEGAYAGIGGGKDSSLVVTLLQKMNIPVFGYATKVRSIPLLHENTQSLGVPFEEITRTLDPQLHTLKENVYLGHIPISLLYACTGVVLAHAKKIKYVLVGNESSADAPNTIWLGRPVNHQWSKTSEFEQKIQAFVRSHVHPSITYASLLRPFASLQIVKLYAALCGHTFAHISSCNRNFTVQDTNTNRWCGKCAKCLGTYILMGPCTSATTRNTILGKDMYTDVELAPLLRELCGLEPVKPFDCVATTEETCYALAHDESFAGTSLASTLTHDDWVQIQERGAQAEHMLATRFPHYLDENLQTKLYATIDACASEL